jgi:hypothetical protein
MSTPEQITVAVAASNTTLYTAFVDTSTRGMLVSLDLTNTTTADITVSCWHENAAGSVLTYFAKDMVVPAKSVASWRGIVVLDASSEKIRAVASATGVDAAGAVMES